MTENSNKTYSSQFQNLSTGEFTKREMFAAMALSGICSVNTGECKDGKKCAKLAVVHADALIAELNREKNNDSDRRL